MNIERIHQPVGVVAEFTAGRCDPVRFLWQRRTHEVARINGRWVDRQPAGHPGTATSRAVAGGTSRREGDALSLNYSVQVGEETYYLRFLTGQMQWWLEQVIVP
jgi:hypothetical protein